MKVRYYTKDGCPLCDEGLAILCTFNGLDIEHIDIEQDEEAFAEYAWRIPVIVRSDNGMELGWPFDDADVESLIR